MVCALVITPGSPWENGYIESFNEKLRDELLDRELFDTRGEVKVLVERWRQAYNRIRPHSALGYRPPAPEAVAPRGARLTLFLVQPGGRSKAHERSGEQRLSTILM
jgi:transposase InsO family protein